MCSNTNPKCLNVGIFLLFYLVKNITFGCARWPFKNGNEPNLEIFYFFFFVCAFYYHLWYTLFPFKLAGHVGDSIAPVLVDVL